jgi:N4-gp56 family major capsid protein
MTTWPVQTDASYGGAGAAGSAQNAANTFVPKIWSDEVLVQREKNLVAASFFKRINHKGKKGDTIVVPFISNVAAFAKAATYSVTLNQAAEGLINITLDKHFESSKLYEDFFMVQQRYDLRGEYTKKAGYALALLLDSYLLALPAATVVVNGSTGAVTFTEPVPGAGNLPAAYRVVGSDGKTAWSTTANASAGNAADLTDAGIRRMIQTLDDNNVPEDDRALFIPPSQKNALLGIDKFTLFQNIGRTKELTTGMFGEIYGIKVMVTTNCPTHFATDGTTAVRQCILAHKDALCAAIQMDVRVQAQYKQEYLATLVTSDMIFGVKGLRLDADDTTASNHRASHAVVAYVPA